MHPLLKVCTLSPETREPALTLNVNAFETKKTAGMLNSSCPLMFVILRQNEYNPLMAGAWVQEGAKLELLILFRVVSLEFRIACMAFVVFVLVSHL